MKYAIIYSLLITTLSSCYNWTSYKQIKEWEFGQYKLVYSSAIGPVGPHYNVYSVYKNGKFQSNSANKQSNDSCIVGYQEKRNYYIDFNICKNTSKILTPTKLIINNKIDSIKISSSKFNHPKKLSKKASKNFIKQWNKSKTLGYQTTGNKYEYFIIVYSKNSQRHFKLFNNIITEDTKWSYLIKNSKFLD